MYFDIEAHKDCFKTDPNEAYFWHGQTNGIGGQDNAMDIAAENNGKTLEMCMLENRKELEEAGVNFRTYDDGTTAISYGATADEKNNFWESCSKSFAEQASGDVHVIDGKDPRPNGQAESEYPCVYNRIEHDALTSNANVNNIIHIDPESRTPTETESLRQSTSETAPATPSAKTENPDVQFGTPPATPPVKTENPDVQVGTTPDKAEPLSLGETNKDSKLANDGKDNDVLKSNNNDFGMQ